MNVRISCLVCTLLCCLTPAFAQNLHQEGEGLFLEASPFGLGVGSDVEGGGWLTLAATYRLNDRFDVVASLTELETGEGYALGTGLGYTRRFGESPWGLRSSVFFTNLDVGAPSIQIAGYRAVETHKRFQLYPGLGLYTQFSMAGAADVAGFVTGSRLILLVQMPTYVGITKRVQVGFTPVYPILLRPGARFVRGVGIGASAQVLF